MERPNVILMNCDDLGWGDLGCTGHPQHKTPHIDRMAAEGSVFSDFYMASSVCSPSRGAMLTGCYPRRIGFGDFDGNMVLFPGQPVGLNPNEITLGGMLRERGYRTRIIGKWHCGDQPEFLPTRHGFDGYYGIPYSNDMGRQADDEPDRQWPPLPLLRDETVVEAQFDQSTVTARYVEDAVSFLRQNRRTPFFLYLAHMYVHLPHYVPDRFLQESENGRYGAAVAAIDWSMGVLLAELKRLEIDENTLVLFTSDNGSRNDFGPSCGALRGRKFTTWEGGLRVPFIARWPGTVPADRHVAGILSAIDLFPTLARITGAEIPSDRTIDGIDASGLLLGNTEVSPRREFLYYQGNVLEAVRSDDWKLHIQRGSQEVRELYNLRQDIGETTDLTAVAPDIVSRLEELVRTARMNLGDQMTGQDGDCRPIGRIPEGQTLTRYDPNHPYYMAEYDLAERG
jgi:arylsulfatase A